GKMRYLVMLTAQRVPQFPELPTLKESGVDVYIDSPYGVAGPKGMDQALVAQLSTAFHQALLSPAGKRVIEQLNQQ
ncbi:tripartite tricarboxylate transporter substrate-binding protein, partial [Staphylococcus aureus]|nr:tripartite tricarboxylate transporter substrate-binding protein [Staphylococcus aureus]